MTTQLEIKVPSIEHWLTCFPDTPKGHKAALKLTDKYKHDCAHCYWNQPSKVTGNRSCQSKPLIEGVNLTYINKVAGTAICKEWRIAPDAEDRCDGFNTWL